MNDWITALLALQDTDLRIRKLEKRLELLPVEKVNLENKLVETQKELKEKSEGFKKTELEIKKVESDIKHLNDKIRDIQSKSALVKKNDEYKAMLSEISGLKQKISDLETEEIILFDKQEEEKNALGTLEKRFREKKKNIEDGIAEIEEITSEIKEELEKVRSGRSGFEKKVDQNILPEYTRILKSGRGIPLVPITDGNCGNCHLRVTPQTITEARKKAVARCDNCSHILYFED
jgi:hypothetical protein